MFWHWSFVLSSAYFEQTDKQWSITRVDEADILLDEDFAVYITQNETIVVFSGTVQTETVYEASDINCDRSVCQKLQYIQSVLCSYKRLV